VNVTWLAEITTEKVEPVGSFPKDGRHDRASLPYAKATASETSTLAAMRPRSISAHIDIVGRVALKGKIDMAG
jgi:hypothetical protein